MAELSTEIITQILSKLPVKSLIRFKCVSKSWYCLIKSPNFVKFHLNQTLISNTDRHLLLYDTTLYCGELDLRRKKPPLILGAPPPFRNRLHCLLQWRHLRHKRLETAIFFYNPLTRSHHKIADIPGSNLRSNVTLFGFGYDVISDDYKVLKIVQGYDDDDGGVCFEAKVFSLKNDSWKCVQEISVPCFFAYKDSHGCLVNGVLHYIVFRKGTGEKDYWGMKMLIACFDLRTESFSVLDCPPCNHDDINKFTDLNTLVLFLRELGGCLSVMKIFYVENQAPDKLHDYIMYRADLWVMKEYGKKESWVRLFTTRFSRKIIGA